MVFESTMMVFPQRKRAQREWSSDETCFEPTPQKRHLSENLALSLGMLDIAQPQDFLHQHQQQPFQHNLQQQQQPPTTLDGPWDSPFDPQPCPIRDIEDDLPPSPPVLIEDDVERVSQCTAIVPVSNVQTHRTLVRVPFCLPSNFPAEAQGKAIVRYVPPRPMPSSRAWDDEDEDEDDDQHNRSYFMEVD